MNHLADEALAVVLADLGLRRPDDLVAEAPHALEQMLELEGLGIDVTSLEKESST